MLTKRTLYLLLAFFAGCAVTAALGFKRDLQIAWAADQIEIFRAMQAQAEGNVNPAALTGCIGYAMNYYPFGTKQRPGSHLNAIVEDARADAISHMLDRLRKITGEDLGQSPEKWLQKFSHDQ